jgi:hypothetical protein
MNRKSNTAIPPIAAIAIIAVVLLAISGSGYLNRKNAAAPTIAIMITTITRVGEAPPQLFPEGWVGFVIETGL